MKRLSSFERATMLGVMANAVLGAALGVLAAGARGAPAGWLAGMLLALSPLALRAVAWTIRPGGLVRFVAGQIGSGAVAVSASIARTVSRPVTAVARALRGPALITKLATYGTAAVVLHGLVRMGRVFATPLGIANLVALLVFAANTTPSVGASIALFASLPAMVLVLLVTLSESA